MALRAVHTTEAVYFFASWPGDAPLSAEPGERNKLIVHYEVPAPWPGAADLMCLTACHTAYVDDQGRGRYITAETIPPGQTDPLQVGGGWRNGRWTMEWGRPLASSNPFDVQFTDLAGRFRFFVKIIEGQLNQPDPTSDDWLLLFQNDP